jgi:hypothetical protein
MFSTLGRFGPSQGLKIRGRALINVVGIMCPPVEIGLTDLPKTGRTDLAFIKVLPFSCLLVDFRRLFIFFAAKAKREDCNDDKKSVCRGSMLARRSLKVDMRLSRFCS